MLTYGPMVTLNPNFTLKGANKRKCESHHYRLPSAEGIGNNLQP